MTGIVKGFEVGKNRDGTKNVLLLKVEISGTDDIQTVQYMNAPGDDSIPPSGSIVTILSAGKSWKIAIACHDGKDFNDKLNEGEKYLYSKDESSFIKILNDGTIEINGDADNAVRFSDLKSGFDSLVAFINAHTHPFIGVPVGNPGTTAVVSTPSNDTIDSAKVDEVKLP